MGRKTLEARIREIAADRDAGKLTSAN